jgi:hypothetical protein
MLCHLADDDECLRVIIFVCSFVSFSILLVREMPTNFE